MSILTEDRPGILLQILKILDFYAINLSDIATAHPAEGVTEVFLDLEFASPSKMHYLLEDLKSRKDLIKIQQMEIL
ncbi:MAG: hypothetical protein H6765_10770 [Candidatus Peribacteria bacterium]|nr:MAG: hypothetical protein H6765_10770 [Candidatus Peribacteria bacterium]